MKPLSWNNRPALDYVGPRRKTFRAKDTVNCTPDAWTTVKRWTKARQAWAIGQGFFVQLCTSMPTTAAYCDMQRPIIHSLVDQRIGVKYSVAVEPSPPIEPSVVHPDWHVIAYSRPKSTIHTIVRHAREGDPDYLYLFQFIEQQDQHGWYGMWDDEVKVATRTMAWYKHYMYTNKGSKFHEKRLARKRALAKLGSKSLAAYRANRNKPATMPDRSVDDQRIIDARMKMTDAEMREQRFLETWEFTSTEIADRERFMRKKHAITTLHVDANPVNAEGSAKEKKPSRHRLAEIELNRLCAELVAKRKAREKNKKPAP